MDCRYDWFQILKISQVSQDHFVKNIGFSFFVSLAWNFSTFIIDVHIAGKIQTCRKLRMKIVFSVIISFRYSFSFLVIAQIPLVNSIESLYHVVFYSSWFFIHILIVNTLNRLWKRDDPYTLNRLWKRDDPFFFHFWYF